MKIIYGLFALVFFGGIILAGCMHPIVKVEKTCFAGKKTGERLCRCRDLETGRFEPCIEVAR